MVQAFDLSSQPFLLLLLLPFTPQILAHNSTGKISGIRTSDVDLVVLCVLMVIFLVVCVIVSLPVNLLERIFTNKKASEIFNHEEDPCIMWVPASTKIPEDDLLEAELREEEERKKEKYRKSTSFRSSRQLYSNYHLFGVLKR